MLSFYATLHGNGLDGFDDRHGIFIKRLGCNVDFTRPDYGTVINASTIEGHMTLAVPPAPTFTTA